MTDEEVLKRADEIKKGKVKRSKGGFMKGIIVCIMLFLICFVVTCLYIAYRGNAEPSTLIMSVFAFCGTEVGLLGWIKASKEKSRTKATEVAKREDEDNV